MNVELLRKIAQVIQERPAEFSMAFYHCGTTHCIGGWAQMLGSQQFCGDFQPLSTYDFADRPEAVLRISEAEAERLFDESSWPIQFQPSTPTQAAARIEHFIATGGAE